LRQVRARLLKAREHAVERGELRRVALLDRIEARLELDLLIVQQIVTLRQPTSLSSDDLDGFLERSAKINILYRELDRRKPLPLPVHRSKVHLHPAA